jgi:hypothetical protein
VTNLGGEKAISEIHMKEVSALIMNDGRMEWRSGSKVDVFFEISRIAGAIPTKSLSDESGRVLVPTTRNSIFSTII